LGGNRTGWTVGAGIEYALDNNWHLKAEYLYADYGNKTVSYDQGKGIRSNITTNTVRVGLSYRFGGMSSAPVMARY
jgi:outer membrane immunogenic protein